MISICACTVSTNIETLSKGNKFKTLSNLQLYHNSLTEIIDKDKAHMEELCWIDYFKTPRSLLLN